VRTENSPGGACNTTLPLQDCRPDNLGGIAFRLLDVFHALPELLFWVTELRPLPGFRTPSCPPRTAVLGYRTASSLGRILPRRLCASYFSPSKRLACLILDLRTRGGMTFVVPTSPRRLPKSPPRHLPSVPGKKPRQKPWARRSSFSNLFSASFLYLLLACLFITSSLHPLIFSFLLFLELKTEKRQKQLK